MVIYYTMSSGLSPKFGSEDPGSQEKKCNTDKNRKKKTV